jgi:hypothetical protein
MFSTVAFVYEEQMPDMVVLKFMSTGGQTLHEETRRNCNLY